MSSEVWSVSQAYNSVSIWALCKKKDQRRQVLLLLLGLSANRHRPCSPHLEWRIVVGGELTDCQEYTVSVTLSTEDHEGGQCVGSACGPHTKYYKFCRETAADCASYDDFSREWATVISLPSNSFIQMDNLLYFSQTINLLQADWAAYLVLKHTWKIVMYKKSQQDSIVIL